MVRIFQYVRFFWMTVFLLIISGLAVHAYIDFSHAINEGEQSSFVHTDSNTPSSAKDNCPQNHCCHFHTFVKVMSSKNNPLLDPYPTNHVFADMISSLPNTPVWEIDYPPRFS